MTRVRRSVPDWLPPFMSNFNGWWLVVLVGLVLLTATLPLSTYSYVTAHDSGAKFPSSFWVFHIILFIGLPAPVVGYLSDRMGPRRITLYGLVILAAAVFCLIAARGLWLLYAVTAVAVVGQSLSGWVPQMTILSRWFVRHRATAIGLALALSGIGGLVLENSLQWDSGPPGWRLAGLGGVVLVIAVLAFVRLRDRPETLPSGGPPTAQRHSLSTAQALRTRAFWLIVLGDGFAFMGVSTVSTFLVGIALDAGSSLGTIGTLILVQSCVTWGFYLIGGLAGDRMSKSSALAFFTAVQTLALVLLALTGSRPLLFAAAVMMSIGSGGRAPLRVAIFADYFGMGSLGKILGLFALFAGLPVVTVLMVGWVYGIPGGFAVPPNMVVMAGLGLVSMVCFLEAQHPATASEED